MSGKERDDRLDEAMEAVDEGRRAVLKKLLLGAVFAAPVIRTFAAPESASAQGKGPPDSTPPDWANKGKGKGKGGKGKGKGK